MLSRFWDVVRDQASKIPSLITEYVHNVDFKVLYPRFSDYDVRFYMYELLKVRKTDPSMVTSSQALIGSRLLPFEGYYASRCKAAQCHDRS